MSLQDAVAAWIAQHGEPELLQIQPGREDVLARLDRNAGHIPAPPRDREWRDARMPQPRKFGGERID